MSDVKIETLISLLEKGEMSKDELVLAMNQIQFQAPPLSENLAPEQEQANNSSLERQNFSSLPTFAANQREVLKDRDLQGIYTLVMYREYTRLRERV